jgi:hypothetical protein
MEMSRQYHVEFQVIGRQDIGYRREGRGREDRRERRDRRDT